ncbi:hypothetical protein DID80_05490, partial [Candidatus Marinamargulisbacteria bacterium SCGC AAA071-K20]
MTNLSQDLSFNTQNMWGYLQDLSVSSSNRIAETTLEESLEDQPQIHPTDYATLNFPDSPFQDIYLRFKLVDYASTIATNRITATYPLNTEENVQTVLRYLHQGASALDSDQIKVAHDFLKVVQLPEVLKTMALSPTQLARFNDCCKDVSDCCFFDIPEQSEDDARWVEQSKELRESFYSSMDISEEEIAFRNRTQLVDVDNIEIDFLINILVADGVIDLTGDDNDIAATVLTYVQDNFKYQEEASSKKAGSTNDDVLDYWQSVEETLELGVGDCEDLTLLTASLLSNVMLKKGHSRDEVAQMVKISAGYVPFEGKKENFKMGHTIVKFNATPEDPDQTLVLESTAKVSPFLLKNFEFEEVLEFNDRIFTAFQTIDENFVTASELAPAAPSMNIFLNNSTFGVDPNSSDFARIEAELKLIGQEFDTAANLSAYQANKDTLLWRINFHIMELEKHTRTPLEVPKLFNGAMYRRGIGKSNYFPSGSTALIDGDKWIDLDKLSETDLKVFLGDLAKKIPDISEVEPVVINFSYTYNLVDELQKELIKLNEKPDADQAADGDTPASITYSQIEELKAFIAEIQTGTANPKYSYQNSTSEYSDKTTYTDTLTGNPPIMATFPAGHRLEGQAMSAQNEVLDVYGSVYADFGTKMIQVRSDENYTRLQGESDILQTQIMELQSEKEWLLSSWGVSSGAADPRQELINKIGDDHPDVALFDRLTTDSETKARLKDNVDMQIYKENIFLQVLGNGQGAVSEVLSESLPSTPLNTDVKLPFKFSRTLSKGEVKRGLARGQATYTGQQVVIDGYAELYRLVQAKHATDTMVKDIEEKLRTANHSLESMGADASGRVTLEEKVTALKLRRAVLINEKFSIFEVINSDTDNETFSFSFFDVNVKALDAQPDPNFMNVFNTYGGGGNDSGIDTKLQSVRINDEKFFTYINQTRRHINTITSLFHIANGITELMLYEAREVHDMYLSQDIKKGVDESRKEADKTLGKVASGMNKFQNKMYEGITQVVDEMFNYVKTANDTIFRKKELQIEQWARRSSDDNVVGMIKDFILGGTFEFANALTGALDYIRSKALEQLHQEQLKVAIHNANAYIDYARIITSGRMTDLTENEYKEDGIFLHDEGFIDAGNFSSVTDNPNHPLNFGTKSFELLYNDIGQISDKHRHYSRNFIERYLGGIGGKSADASSATGRLSSALNYGFDPFRPNELQVLAQQFNPTLNVQSLQNDDIFHRAQSQDAGSFAGSDLAAPGPISSGLDMFLDLLGVGGMKADIASGAASNTPDPVPAGLNQQIFLDYNMEKNAYFRERATFFQIQIFLAMMIKQQEWDKMKQIAQEIAKEGSFTGQSKSTGSSSGMVKAAEQTLENELLKQKQALDVVHQQSMSLMQSVNTLTESRIEYYKSAYNLILKNAKVLTMIAVHLLTGRLATKLSNKINTKSAEFYTKLTAFFAIKTPLPAPPLWLYAGMQLLGMSRKGYWQYVFNAFGSATTESIFSALEKGINDAVPGYQHHLIMQNEDSSSTGFGHYQGTATRSLSGNINDDEPRYGYTLTQNRLNSSKILLDQAKRQDPFSHLGGTNLDQNNSLHNYYQSLSQNLLLQPRQEFNRTTAPGTPVTFTTNSKYTSGHDFQLENIPVDRSFTNYNGEGAQGRSFIESLGDGSFAYNGLLTATKIPIATALRNKLRMHLLIIRAIYDAVEGEIAFMFSKGKPGGMSKFDGAAGFNVIETLINDESAVINDLRTEISNYLLSGLNANIAKDKERYGQGLSIASHGYGIASSLAGFIPLGIGEVVHKVADIAIDTDKTLKRIEFGDFAGMGSNYWEDGHANNRINAAGKIYQDFVNPPIVASDRDGYTVEEQGFYSPGLPQKFNLSKDRWTDYSGPGYTFSGLPKYLGDLPDPQEAAQPPVGVDPFYYYNTKVKQLTPWFQLDELEKHQFHLLTHNSKGRSATQTDGPNGGAFRWFKTTDAGVLGKEEINPGGEYAADVMGHEFIGIGKSSTLLNFKQVEYTEVGVVQEELNRIFTIRAFLLMIEQAVYNAKQNLMQSMFGLRSSAGIIEKTMSMVDDYNSSQLDALNESVSELNSRVQSENVYRNAEIELAVELLLTGLMIKLTYSSAKATYATTSSGRNYVGYAQEAVKNAVKVNLARALINFTIGLMALLSARPTPTINKAMVMYDTDEDDEEDQVGFIENVKNGILGKTSRQKGATLNKAGSDDQKSLHSEGNAITPGDGRVVKVRVESSDKKDEKSSVRDGRGDTGPRGIAAGLEKDYEEGGQASDDNNQSNFMSSGDVKFTGRGRFTLNTSVKAKAQTKLKATFRKIKLKNDIMLQMQDAMTDAVADATGVESTKAFKGISSILNKIESSQRSQIDMQFKSMENVVAAKNRGMDKMKSGAQEMIKQVIEKAAKKVQKTIEKRNKKKLAKDPKNLDASGEVKVKTGLTDGNISFLDRLKFNFASFIQQSSGLISMGVFDMALDGGVFIHTATGDTDYSDGEAGEDTAGEDADNEIEGDAASFSEDEESHFAGTGELQNAILDMTVAAGNISIQKQLLDELKEYLSSAKGIVEHYVKAATVDKVKKMISDAQDEEVEKSEEVLEEAKMALEEAGYGDMLNMSVGELLQGAMDSGQISNKVKKEGADDEVKQAEKPGSSKGPSVVSRLLTGAGHFSLGVLKGLKTIVDIADTALTAVMLAPTVVMPKFMRRMIIDDKSYNELRFQLSNSGEFKRNIASMKSSFKNGT